MKNRLYAYFDINPSIGYPIVEGSTYTETFNEEINSMAITLDFVGIEGYPRLVFDRPYHFVKIVNNIPQGETGLLFGDKNYIIMLVDNYVEHLNSLGEEKIYRYEINLMNCVKLLEKIQCPNLVITHSLIEGEKKSIYDYINQYMIRYCPKVKISNDGENWDYEYLLKWQHLESDEKFQIQAADMQMNEPTLRQVITNLMLQVACIPVLDFRTLKYIDFNEEQTPIEISDDDGINFIVNSGASDSYVNELVQSPTQALDEENEVISDIVGFRDSQNAIIKQTENLQLEVRYPIYKIKRVLMRSTDNKIGYFAPLNQDNDAVNSFYPIVMSMNNQPTPYKYSYGVSIRNTGEDDNNFFWSLKMNFIYAPDSSQDFISRVINLSSPIIHLCKKTSDGYIQRKTISAPRGWLLYLNSSIDTNKTYTLNSDGTVTEDSSATNPVLTRRYHKYSLTITFTTPKTTETQTEILTYCDYIYITGDMYLDEQLSEATPYFIPMSKIVTHNGNYYCDTKTNLFQYNRDKSFTSLYDLNDMELLTIPATIGSYVDISDLVVENGKRRLLDVDYLAMQAVINNTNSDPRDLAKYIYGTMGYNIGDTKITGFSQTYSRAQMWWSYDESYFDTILEFLNARKSRLLNINVNEFITKEEDAYTEYRNKYYPGFYNNDAFYAIVENNVNWLDENYSKMKFLFYITYQPLNNLKFKLSKQGKEYPFAIEQLNQSGDGLSDFSRLVKNVQDTVNRIGNEVKSLPQTIDDKSKIKPLNSVFDKYTIFNRQFAIYENYLTVNYTASENYVIKNYFTSIITKYRAYQYVDYNQSVVRKENEKIYCLISDKHYYDGDDKVVLFNNVYDINDLRTLLNIQDVENYVNFEPDGANFIQFVSSFSIDFNYLYQIDAFTALISSSSKYSYFGIGTLYIPTEYNSLSINIEPNYDTQLQTAWESAYAYNLVFQAGGNGLTTDGYGLMLNGIFPKLKQTVEERYTSLIPFIETEYAYNSSHTNKLPQTYIKQSQMTILDKMDGQIIRWSNNNYYRIHLEISNNYTDYDLESKFRIDKYPEIYAFFTDANTKILGYAEAYYPTTEYYYYSTHNISLRYTLSPFKIYLEQVAISEVSPYRTLLLSGLVAYNSVENIITPKYVIKSSYNQALEYEETKNECSILSYDNGFSIYYQDYDNVSSGPYLHSLTLSETDSSNPYAVGGYLQKWQLWDQNSYNESHQIYFVYYIQVKDYDSQTNIDAYISQLPIINKGWQYKQYTTLQIVDNNKANTYRYTFYKDNAEVINQNVQFEYYNDTGDVIWNKNFINNMKFVNRFKFDIDNDIFRGFDLTNKEFKLKDKVYNGGFALINTTDFYEVDYDEDFRTPYILIKWSNIASTIEQFKISVVNIDSNQYVNCRDMMAFKRNGRTQDTKYYLTLNDTKTSDVWYFSDEDDLFTIYECDNADAELENPLIRKCSLKQ